ncbi:hypothetical protein [Muricoccus vinaceus]|uniref:Uncharacterized protein n=1 Tax=Muricoccus vinaceus TaxID=424704 RepID=A0ABV6IM88_9PROT
MSATPAYEIPALESLAGIANDNLPEPLRHEAAARILLAARQLRGLVRATQDQDVVDAVAAGWDPRAVTALEFAEGLPVRTLDSLLGNASRWARAMRALIEDPRPGSAAA